MNSLKTVGVVIMIIIFLIIAMISLLVSIFKKQDEKFNTWYQDVPVLSKNISNGLLKCRGGYIPVDKVSAFNNVIVRDMRVWEVTIDKRTDYCGKVSENIDDDLKVISELLKTQK